MYLVAIGWMYVVFMMSITEETIVAGFMTFLFYGLVPVSIILYLAGSRRRRLRRQIEDENQRNAANSFSREATLRNDEEGSDLPSSN